jgi:hypothetical protein
LEIRNISAKCFDRARGIGVGSNLEWIFARQFQQRRDLLWTPAISSLVITKTVTMLKRCAPPIGHRFNFLTVHF